MPREHDGDVSETYLKKVTKSKLRNQAWIWTGSNSWHKPIRFKEKKYFFLSLPFIFWMKCAFAVTYCPNVSMARRNIDSQCPIDQFHNSLQFEVRDVQQEIYIIALCCKDTYKTT